MTTLARPASTTPCRAPVTAAGVALLEQCGGFIGAVASQDGHYARTSRILPGGTIGKHVRHCLDHFRAALEGFDRSAPIDYDHRERNVPMESEPAAALEAIFDLAARLRILDAAALASPVRVRVMLSGDGQEAELDSTLGRELAFATHHAVHHHAMMGAIAAELGIQVGPEFGKAPSTLHHERVQP